MLCPELIVKGTILILFSVSISFLPWTEASEYVTILIFWLPFVKKTDGGS